MNGRKAKKLRRAVFGEGSKRNPKEYTVDSQTGSIRCKGKRSLYQRAKRFSK